MEKIKDSVLSQKQNKLTDKAFMHSIYVSILSMIMCIVALCSATYAWFSGSVISEANTIKSGSCDVTVTVTKSGDESIVITPNTEGVYTFLANTAYNIKITSEGTATSSYCIVSVSGTDYYTEQISTSEPNNTILFTLTFDSDTDVEIITCWGTYHITNRERDFYNGKSYTNLKNENAD